MKRIILVGKAASGKTYLSKELQKLGYKISVSHTSRPKRPGEKNGIDYHFCTETEFKILIRFDSLKEYCEFNNWYYGQTIREFEQSNLSVMTPSGIAQLSKEDLEESIIIYLDIDENIRRKRLEERVSADSLDRRMAADEKDFKDFTTYNIRITDDNVTSAQIQMRLDKML